MEQKKTILLVDDDLILSEVMQRRIEESGYRCIHAQNGQEGLVLIRKEHPDLVLLDIAMPTTNGYEVLTQMRDDPTLSKIPVIVISNSGQPVEIEKILMLGVKDYMVKAHFTPAEVLDKVNAVFGGTVSSGPRPQDTKILIIDDDELLRSISSDRFRKAGFQVFTATDGKEGIEATRSNRPDLVFLDLIMPTMDGKEALKKLKADPDLRSIPVIVFTNLERQGDVEALTALGAAGLLAKASLTPSQIVDKARQYLAAHPHP